MLTGEVFCMEEKREGVRLNRYLAETGLCSRREADRLIESGQVRVDGRVISKNDYDLLLARGCW